jgi:protease-4
VENFYDQFVDRVAEARGLDRSQVDAVARGRVWTGAQARERKLVDNLGSFRDAIASAKKRANLSGEVEIDDEIDVRADLADLASPLSLSAIPGNVAPRAVRALRLLGEPGTLRAALPFDLEVR